MSSKLCACDNISPRLQSLGSCRLQPAVQLHIATIFLYVLAHRDGNSDLLSSMQIRTQPHVSAPYAVVSHSTPLRDILLISNSDTLCLSLHQVANGPDGVVCEYLAGPVFVCATSQSAPLRLSWLGRGRPSRVNVKTRLRVTRMHDLKL